MKFKHLHNIALENARILLIFRVLIAISINLTKYKNRQIYIPLFIQIL